MAFVIFGDSFTFPEGNAATNRVYTYARGFNNNGNSVHIICFENEYLSVNDGVIDDINFYHPFGQRKRNKYFILRRLQKFIKYFKTVVLIRKINRKDKIIAINCWTMRPSTQFFAFIIAKFLRTKMILERSEHPMRNYKDNGLSQLYGKLNLALEIKLCDGIFCISNYLISFYNDRGLSQNRLFLVPSTVDTGRFDLHFNPPLSYKYILYCGSLTVLKDGVNILIESYAKISEKYPEINLVLIGKGDSVKDEMFMKELVMRLNIDRKVIFLGQLPRVDIPAYLSNAEVLALARPKSKIADAGFPSKLTEYLATGRPVVVTRVGEIPVYLKDNENAFLSIPDSVNAFAEKLDYVLSNYEFAQQVGERGKELTATVFNYNVQAKRMLGFIKSL